jgi:hypothetical protein
MRNRRLATLGLAAILLLSGCSSEDAPPTAPGGDLTDTLRVTVRHRDTGLPGAGVKLVAMDPDNRLAAPPARADSAGQADLGITAAAGPLYVVAFTGDSLFVHQLPPPLAWPDPAPTAEVLVASRTQTGWLPRIAGTVVAADTQAPLEGAFISLSPYLYGYLGRVTVSDDVTLADGAFRVSDIPFAADPVSGNLRQISPLLVTCEGYLPVAYLHPMAHGDNNLDIIGAMIALERIDADGGSGTLSGVVHFGPAPVAGLPIGLGGIGPLGGKAGVGLPGQVALTDQDGRYTFTDLPAGGYLLQAGHLPDDGWLMPSQPASRLYSVAAGSSVTADTLQVIRAINPLEPVGPVAVVPDRFGWEAVAEADSYTVYLGGAVLARTAVAEATGLDLTDLPAGWHSWTVTAKTAAGEVVGSTETFARFRVPAKAVAGWR